MSLDTNVIQQYYAGILRLTPSAATINAYAQLPSYEAAMDAMMNAAVSSVNPITKLYQAAFDRVPDSAGLTNYTAAYGAGAGTMTLKQIATQWTSTIEFTTDYPASMPNADYVGLLYWNVLHRAADPVGAANFTAALNSGKLTRADVLLELSQSPEFDLRIDGHIRGFQEQAALNDPAAYTGTLWDKVPPGPGESFTLTTNIDTFTATTDNAVFNAVSGTGATLTTGDILTGAGGINTLNVTGNGDSSGALVQTTKIQDVVIRGVNTLATSQINQILMSGVERVASQGSLTDVEVDNAQLATTYALKSTVAGQDADLTVNYQATSGTADTAKLSVNNAGDKTGSTTTTQTLTVTTGAGAIEAISLATTGTNYVEVVGTADVATLTVTGDGTNDITVGTTNGDLLLDASATTGTNTLRMGTALTSLDTVKGGSGTDTLEATPNAGTTYATISGVENLNFKFDTAGATQDLRNVTGATTLNLTGDETLAVQRAAASIATINMKSTTSAAGDDVNVTYTTGSNAAHTLNIGSTATSTQTVVGGDVTIAGNAGALTVNSVGNGANAVDSITDNKATSLTVNTTQDLNVAGGGVDDISATAATTAVFTTAGGDLTVADDLVLTKATSIELNAESGLITVTGDVATSADTQLAFVASGSDDNDIRVAGQVNALYASLISAKASGGADVTLDDLVIAGTNAAGDNIDTEVSLVANGVGSTVTVSDITVGTVTLDLVTVQSDADGAVNFTATDTSLTITEIDATASAGALTIDVSTLAAGTTVNTGSGDTTATLSGNADTYVGGAGADTVWGMAAADDITLGGGHDIVGFTTLVTSDVVNDFVAGATTVASSDLMDIDVSLFTAELDVLVTGATVITGDGTEVTAATAVSIQTVSAAATLGATKDVIYVTGTYATTADLITAIEAGGSRAFTLTNARGDGLFVVYQDAAGNTDLAVVTVDEINSGGTIGTGKAAVHSVATLVGVTTADLVAGNFDFV